MKGLCGTCLRPATATEENEGYSYCCNDRIEYDLEAAEHVMERIEDMEAEAVATRKRIASLASKVSRLKREGLDTTVAATDLLHARAYLKADQAEIKVLKKIHEKGV